MEPPAGRRQDGSGGTRWRLPSDIGGQPAARVDRRDLGHTRWELLAAGVRMALIRRGLFTWDEGRRAVEGLGHERYRRLGYEERKLAAVETLLLEKGLVTREELAPGTEAAPMAGAERDAAVLAARARALSASPEPRFAAGQRVRVRDEHPPGHVRTPAYLRGKPGRVVRAHGPFPNPETLAYGDSGRPAQWLYTIEFRHGDVWGTQAQGAGDRVRADIYEHWIEAEEATRARP